MESDSQPTLHEDQVRKAVEALLKHIKSVQKETELETGKQELLENSDFMSLVFTLKKIPSKHAPTSHKIRLRHPLYTADDTTICLFVKDPQREYKDLLVELNVDFITKVVGLKKLRANYKSFDNKRELCSSFDLFLADDRIVPMLPKLLGKQFFRQKKMPFSVSLKDSSKVEKQLNRARQCTHLTISSGTCIAVRIGRVSFSPDELIENIIGSVQSIVEKIPSRWKNIQAIHLRTNDSVALPMFSSLPTE